MEGSIRFYSDGDQIVMKDLYDEVEGGNTH